MEKENLSKRVRLYILHENHPSLPEWIHKGTGHIISTKNDNRSFLKVFSEDDDSVLLDVVILSDTSFEKHQETLILWCDKNDDEYALSFQEKEVCEAIWAIICSAQEEDRIINSGKKLSVIDESDELEDDVLLNLPEVDTSNLKEINEMIRKFQTSDQKEKLTSALLKANYIGRLLDVFHLCEVENNFESLAVLCEIFKHIITLSNCSLFEELFEEIFKKERIFDVVGCFEYDRCVHAIKQHREFLRQNVQYKEVIPVSNLTLLDKIHQTYRIQYIQDIILPSINALDESIFLSPFLYVNKVAIVNMIQDDEVFLKDIFGLLTCKATENMKRKNVLLFLKELFSFAQNLQPSAREIFYKNLIDLKIVQALEISLQMVTEEIKSAAIEVFNFIVEYSPSLVRKYMLEQANAPSENIPLITLLICGLTCEADYGQNISTYLSLFKLLLNPESMESSLIKSEKTEFLNYFYENAIDIIIKPIVSISRENSADGCLSVILELLEFCVEHHSYHIRNIVIHKDVIRHVLYLMNSQNTILALSALRFIRKIIALKDEFYNKYIINGDLLQPVVEAFFKNRGRYNMLDSAILEMFEFIRTEELKSLCSYVMERYGDVLDNVKYVQTFKCLRHTYEQNCLRNKLKTFPIYLEDCFKKEDSWYSEYSYKVTETVPENNSVSEKNGDSADGCLDDMEIEKQELGSIEKICNSPRPQSIILDRTPIFRKMGRILRPGILSRGSGSKSSCRKRLMDYEFSEDDDKEDDEERRQENKETEKQTFAKCKRVRLD